MSAVGAKPVKPMDAAWLYVESRDTPMHVAGLQVFEPPKGAGVDFLHSLVTEFKRATRLASPWNRRLAANPLGRWLPAWETDHHVDLDYHVRHSALPSPGGERELGVLVSRLHSHPLDLQRPLWECHVIEGLEGGRFAVYTKMHHALVDGVGGMRMVQRVMSTNPRQHALQAPWSAPAPRRPPAEDGNTGEGLQAVLGGALAQLRSLPEAARGIGAVLRSIREPGALTVPYGGPKSVLNERITGARRFATQRYDLARLRRMAVVGGVTLNDIVLDICASALRRFLKEAGSLPKAPLTAGIPVSVRPQGDDSPGTAISFILADLATEIDDPVERLRRISASTRAAKTHLQSLPREALTQYTMLLMGPFILGLVGGLGGRGRPMFNLAISNVPGPDRPLYLGGAKLEAMYPVSVLTHGQALNITCVSYAGWLNFGFTGCRDSLPHMQRLAVYCGEALDALDLALDAAAGVDATAAPNASRRTVRVSRRRVSA